jgi:hypothetical protein
MKIMEAVTIIENEHTRITRARAVLDEVLDYFEDERRAVLSNRADQLDSLLSVVQTLLHESLPHLCEASEGLAEIVRAKRAKGEATA